MPATNEAPLSVQLISAKWCRRCEIIKPEVEALCKAAGATFVIVDYDELDEDDPVKSAVTALPTIQMHGKMYKPAEFDAWRENITAAAVSAAVATENDF